jgi:molecular chaperone DnaK
MVKEAEENATADKARREAVETRNQTEAMVNQVEKTLKEAGDNVSAQDKGEAEAAVAAARSALEGTDIAAIKDAGERLSQSAMKLGEAMYKAQAASAQGPAAPDAPQAGPNGEKIVDAEFEEVDDKKKSA